MNEFIKTKLLFELKAGQLIGLGFGNIVNSDADIIIVSAFNKPAFKSQSSIGALSEHIHAKASIDLENSFDDRFAKDGFKLIDLGSSGLPFKKLLVVCMGDRGSYKLYDPAVRAQKIINALRHGLERLKVLLCKETSLFTIDITALGTRYGGILRKECFDMLTDWATDIFNTTNKITFLRFVSYDLDTFVDFFESLHRLKKIKPENELAFSANYQSENFSFFKNDLQTALKNLDDNPRSVIITCRSIIETIVKFRTKNSSAKLADGISAIKDTCPPSIFSYLTTCRILGNFSNHDPNFIPTRRDAEGILILTLRIVEWHLMK